jgi:hypothetical protein
MKRTSLALVLLATLLFAAVPARGDVGVESSSRSTASAGDRIELTIGCGFCFPPCVGEPGHRHPPGDRHGFCMLGGRAGPPKAFPIWLTPLKHSLAPYICDPGAACEPGSSRPPHLPSFIYLGHAVPWKGSESAKEVPRYRLAFDVPEARPGRYKYVIFCDACFDGPRGSLTDSRTLAAGRLRVLASDSPIATASRSGEAGPWIAAGCIAVGLALGIGIAMRRKATSPQAGPA